MIIQFELKECWLKVEFVLDGWGTILVINNLSLKFGRKDQKGGGKKVNGMCGLMHLSLAFPQKVIV